MNLAVCDDDRCFLEEMETLLRQYPFVQSTALYSQMESFLQSLEDGETFDAVLMDLDFGGRKTGLDYAQRLYREYPHLPVIYITGYNDRFAQHILLGETNLLGYLVKPVDPELLGRYLTKIRRAREAGRNVTFTQQGRLYSIPADQIAYIESNNHRALIHLQTTTYTVYEKLSSLLPQLPGCFIQCHKSYIVNMGWVQRVEANCLTLRGGTVLRISRSYAAQTRERIFRFLGQQI